jgi:ribonuclease D
MKPYRLIETEEELRKTADEWRKLKELAIDIECENNLHHYGIFISIIQVSGDGKNWVVDIMKIDKPKPLLEILEDRGIVKIFHDVSFDFRILKKQFGCQPKNIFDTQIAAHMLGISKVGLGHILQEEFGVKKEEKFQKADWAKRPLSDEMLDYAYKDTSYLIALKRRFEEKLKEQGKLEWAQQHFKAIEKKGFDMPDYQPSDVKGYGNLESEKERRVFHSLFYQRDRAAKAANRPFYYIISNKALLRLAQNPPKSAEEWQKMRGVHPIVRKWSRYFDLAVKKAGNVKITERDKKSRLPASPSKKLVDDLKKKRNEIAKKHGITPFMLLSTEDVDRLSSGESPDFLLDWQREMLSGVLKKNKKQAFSLKNQKLYK